MNGPSVVDASTRRSRVHERRVREAGAERVQRRSGRVDVVAEHLAASAARAVVVVDRDLSGVAGNRDREASRSRRRHRTARRRGRRLPARPGTTRRRARRGRARASHGQRVHAAAQDHHDDRRAERDHALRRAAAARREGPRSVRRGTRRSCSRASSPDVPPTQQIDDVGVAGRAGSLLVEVRPVSSSSAAALARSVTCAYRARNAASGVTLSGK